MWSRKAIMATSFLGSGVNVILPFALAYCIDFRYTAIWMALRAGAQLLLAIFPNPISVILYVSRYSRIDRKKLIATGYLWGLIPAVLLIFSAFYFFLLNSYSGEVPWFLVAIYLVFFQISGYEAIIARGIKNSDYLLRASLVDLFFSLVMVVALLVWKEFSLFLSLAIIKEMWRAGYFFWMRRNDIVSPKRPFQGSRVRKITYRYISAHMARSALQVLSQQGDRIIFPLLFGLDVAGQTNLGASLAMIIAIFSSSAFSWSMPQTLEGKNMSGWIFDEWTRLFIISVVMALLIFIAATYLETGLSILGVQNFKISTASIFGFLFASFSSLSFMSMGASAQRLRGKRYFFIHLGWLVVTYTSVVVASTIFGFSNASYALAVGIFVGAAFFFLLNYMYFSLKKIVFIGVFLLASICGILYA